MSDDVPDFKWGDFQVPGPEIKRIDTQNDTMLEAEGTFSKAHHCLVSIRLIFGGVVIFSFPIMKPCPFI